MLNALNLQTRSAATSHVVMALELDVELLEDRSLVDAAASQLTVGWPRNPVISSSHHLAKLDCVGISGLSQTKDAI